MIREVLTSDIEVLKCSAPHRGYRFGLELERVENRARYLRPLDTVAKRNIGMWVILFHLFSMQDLMKENISGVTEITPVYLGSMDRSFEMPLRIARVDEKPCEL